MTEADLKMGKAFYDALRSVDPHAHPDFWEELTRFWQGQFARAAKRFFEGMSK